MPFHQLFDGTPKADCYAWSSGFLNAYGVIDNSSQGLSHQVRLVAETILVRSFQIVRTVP